MLFYVTDKELTEIYTPTPGELRFSRQKTKTHTERLLLLIYLKICQRLGLKHFSQIPLKTIRCLAIYWAFSSPIVGFHQLEMEMPKKPADN